MSSATISASTDVSSPSSSVVLLYTVRGMTCADCADRLKARLLTDDLVDMVDISLMAGSARVQLRSDKVPQSGLTSEALATITDKLAKLGGVLGFSLSPRPAAGARIRFHAASLEKVKAASKGVQGFVDVSTDTNDACECGDSRPKFSVAYDPVLVGARHLFGSLLSALGGVEATKHLLGSNVEDDKQIAARLCITTSSKEKKQKLSILSAFASFFFDSFSLLFAIFLALTSITIEYTLTDDETSAASFPLSISVVVQLTISTITMVLYWIPIANSAVRAAVFSKQATMDTLIALSSGTAYVLAVTMVIAIWSGEPLGGGAYGEPPFSATATLLSLVATAHLLEDRAKAAARATLDQLASLEGKGGRVTSRARCSPNRLTDSSCEAGWKAALRLDEDSLGKKKSDDGDDSAVIINAPSSLSSSTSTAPFIHASLLHLQDIILVETDTLFPTDGVLVELPSEGEALVDEAHLTGESLPVSKLAGDEVFGGTRNVGAALHVRISRLPGNGALSRILALIEEAQSKRPLAATLADSIASRFTPLVILLSIITLAAWWSAAATHKVDTKGYEAFPFALQFALALLVVSCPCAIALAVAPVCLVATSIAAKSGIVLTGGSPALEAFAACNVAVLDKTGTLTMGQASVVDILVSDKSAVQEAALALGVRLPPQVLQQQKSTWAKEAQLLLGAAAAVALESPHPLSTAVRRAALKASLILPESACRGEERHAESGRGIRALAPDGTELRLGSPEWIDSELGLTNSRETAVSAAVSSRQAGRSVIALAVGDDFCGCIALEDEVRPGAKATIDRLRSLGLRVLIASGDNQGAVARAAKAVGINEEDAHSALSPEGKVELVRSIQRGVGFNTSTQVNINNSSRTSDQRSCRVLFVGDGVNDAAALTVADVGVAVQGSTASSAAAAGALLQRDDLDGVADIIFIGRAARKLIAINFLWAALYNLVTMPLAAGVLYPLTGEVTIPLALAGLSEALSTLPVVGGALLLWVIAPTPHSKV